MLVFWLEIAAVLDKIRLFTSDFHATTFDDNADWFDIEKDLEIMKQIESELLEEQR